VKIAYLELGKILDLKKWQVLQDSLAQVTNLAIITIDHKGVPITTHSAPRAFCRYVRNDPKLEKICQKCDSRAGLEAVRINAPFIYLCHCNIVDLAIPISIQGQYIGAVMAGQIRLADHEDSSQLERIFISPITTTFESEAVKQMYEEIPILSYNQVETIAQMLFDLCAYIVEEAVNKNLVLDMYERLSPLKETSTASYLSDYPVGSVESLKKDLGNMVVSAYVKTADNQTLTCKNSVLKPAFDYIAENKVERITQKDMATLCHISVSHFSRLFVKETGESFSNFLSLQKVEWSKQLLEKTDLSINQISDELGFSDPGYYIKVFKKHERITPAIYRKYHSGIST